MNIVDISKFLYLNIDHVLIYHDGPRTWFTKPNQAAGQRLFVNSLSISDEEEQEGKNFYLCSIFNDSLYIQVISSEVDIRSAILSSNTCNFILCSQTVIDGTGSVQVRSYPYYIYSSNETIPNEYLPSKDIKLK
jgi:hypothetical protein